MSEPRGYLEPPLRFTNSNNFLEKGLIFILLSIYTKALRVYTRNCYSPVTIFCLDHFKSDLVYAWFGRVCWIWAIYFHYWSWLLKWFLVFLFFSQFCSLYPFRNFEILLSFKMGIFWYGCWDQNGPISWDWFFIFVL